MVSENRGSKFCLKLKAFLVKLVQTPFLPIVLLSAFYFGISTVFIILWSKFIETPAIDSNSQSNLSSLVTSSKNISSRMHGIVGIPSTTIFQQEQTLLLPSIGKSVINNLLEMRSIRVANLPLTDELPLDRAAPDSRDSFCHNILYNYTMLAKYSATVVIIFHDEPFSMLIRTIHSVLNRTPSMLLDCIIIVDDGSVSNYTESGGALEQYLPLLPKTKLVRMDANVGIVKARLAGAKLVTSPVLIVLDSHVEVNIGWIEPLLQRISESPKSLVFPVVDSYRKDKHLTHTKKSGIGCRLTFKWDVTENSVGRQKNRNSSAVPSPVSPGGIFAIRTDWFWDLGGYDEEFEGWGAENVEQAFRIWMCGGKVECVPCSRTYHKFKKSKKGERNMMLAWKNRLRTASLWMDKWSVLPYLLGPRGFTTNYNERIGDIQRMLIVKDILQCKPFSWYLENITPKQPLSNLSALGTVSHFRNKRFSKFCLDSLYHSGGETFGLHACDSERVAQRFLLIWRKDGLLALESGRLLNWCISPKETFVKCTLLQGGFLVHNQSMLMWVSKSAVSKIIDFLWGPSCLSVVQKHLQSNPSITFQRCDLENLGQHWYWDTMFLPSNLRVQPRLFN